MNWIFGYTIDEWVKIAKVYAYKNSVESGFPDIWKLYKWYNQEYSGSPDDRIRFTSEYFASGSADGEWIRDMIAEFLTGLES